MANPEKIAAAIGTLCEAYNRKPTPLTFKAYEIALEDVSDYQLDIAATHFLKASGKFMPTPGEIRTFARSGGVSFEARADIAWNEFDRAVAHHGGDHSVSFADGVINATVNVLGGWILCCDKTGDDYFVWLQKQFKETYVRMCERSNIAPDLLSPLTGRIQIANACWPTEFLESRGTYNGQVMSVGTSQPVLLPPADAPKRLERAATNGPKRIGEILKLTNQ